MCGIAGLCRFPGKHAADEMAVSQWLDARSHRGPDASGLMGFPAAVLGHRRLSIIDTSAEANQPMTDPSGRYWLVYNGEFFNYREWRGRLEAQGITFRTTSDSEVLLHM